TVSWPCSALGSLAALASGSTADASIFDGTACCCSGIVCERPRICIVTTAPITACCSSRDLSEVCIVMSMSSPPRLTVIFHVVVAPGLNLLHCLYAGLSTGSASRGGGPQQQQGEQGQWQPGAGHGVFLD